MPSPKPTPADVRRAIAIIEAYLWIDPCGLPERTFWASRLYDSEGALCCDGVGDDPGVAMAMAWISYCEPGALANMRVDEDIPEVPAEGYRFELIPPDPHAIAHVSIGEAIFQRSHEDLLKHAGVVLTGDNAKDLPALLKGLELWLHRNLGITAFGMANFFRLVALVAEQNARLPRLHIVAQEQRPQQLVAGELIADAERFDDEEYIDDEDDEDDQVKQEGIRR
jgi:hypothetical protein